MLAGEFSLHIGRADRGRGYVDEAMRNSVDAVKTFNAFEGKAGTPDPERRRAFISTLTTAMQSLVRTDAIYEGHKRALNKLSAELSASNASLDGETLQKRLKELAATETAEAVQQLDGKSNLQEYKNFMREARLEGGADEDEVQCTQEVDSLICALLKSEMVDPTKVVPCFKVGATRCVFSSQAIRQVIQQGRGQVKCPLVGCSYTGMIRLSDLEPCKDTARKLKRAKEDAARERLAQDAAAEDVDALDDEVDCKDEVHRTSQID